MRKTTLSLAALGAMALMASGTASATCATIQDGTLVNSAGELLSPGYDTWGYNYQAKIFNGTYCDAYRDAAWCQAYADVELLMKWNDTWLSNVDCNSDGLLDRHFGYSSYIGSGAWITNHQSGWVDVNGKKRKWTYFVKIVAVDEGDVLEDGYWYRGGVQIGPMIWNQFAIIEEVYNDPSVGAHGIQYKSPLGPGFGIYGDNP